MEIREMTRDNFQTEVTEAGLPVLLVFYTEQDALWKAQLPILEQASDEACDVRFVKADMEKEPELAARFGVAESPTMLILNGDTVFRTMTGLQTLNAVLEALEL